MTLVVFGRGAEDAEDALGRLLLECNAAGRQVISLDLESAVGTTLWRSVEDVVAWVRSTYQPSLTLVVEAPGSALFGPPVPVPVAVRTTRAAALHALHGWLEGDPLPADDVSDAAELRRALDRALPGRVAEITDRAPRVSLVIPIFNQEKYLHATLQSALADRYDDYEVIAVDDGSTDASPQILDHYRGNPRLVVVTQENVGGTGRLDLVLNRAMRAARGELIANIGGDDVSMPHRLSAQVAAFDEDPGLGVCHSAGFMIDASGRRFSSFGLTTAYDDLSFLRDQQTVNLVAHPTAMHSRKALDAVGWYEEGLATDYHWWVKAGGRVRFRYLPQRLIEYRIHDRSVSTTPEGSQRCAREAQRHRRLVAERRSLLDYFPELDGITDNLVWQEAGLAMGNRLIRTDPTLAAHFYELAAASLSSHRTEYNLAVAAHMQGDRRLAVKASSRAAGGSARGAELARGVETGSQFEVDLFGGTQLLLSALADGRLRHGRTARRWDGSLLGVESAYVSLDPSEGEANRRTLGAWSRRTTQHSPVRWVYPDLGRGVDLTLEHLAMAASDAGDLREAADLVIELVDDFALLPPDPSRPTGPLSRSDEHDIFASWMARCA